MRTLLPIALVLLFSSLGTFAQSANPKGQGAESIYSAIPTPERPQAIEVVQRLIKALIGGDCEEVYQLLPADERRPKKKFISRCSSEVRLVKFVPTQVTRLDSGGEWVVAGCAQFADSRKEEGLLSSIYIKKEMDSWRATGVGIILLKDEPNSVRACKF